MNGQQNSPSLLASDNGAGISLMTEDQLTRLLKRLAVLTRDPRSLSAFATPKQPATLVIGNATGVQFLGPNKYRWAIILSSSGQFCDCFFGPYSGSPSGGFRITPNIDPVLLTYNDIGGCILQVIKANATAAGATMFWQEFETPFPLDGSQPFSL
jgi:hypothetical protein